METKQFNNAWDRFMYTELNYECCTTFWDDFTIADQFGINAIKSTYRRGLKTAKLLGVKYLTEFAMVLNHKCWQYYSKNDAYSNLYAELYHSADDYCLDNLKDDDLSYYYRTTK